MATKSTTDQFWDQRAALETDPAQVNIGDSVQRDHELQFVFQHLSPDVRMVEIGCGNGYVSQQLRDRVAHLDAFDYAEAMVARARELYGETNNRFFTDSVLDPIHTRSDYDVALCVRVLINLRDLEEQRVAIANMRGMLRPGGRLILIEGFRDGFDAINALRTAVGLIEAKPASINFYSYLGDLLPTVHEYFTVESAWHSGLFDFLTRIVYPQLVGPENATGPGEFHRKIEPLVRANTLPDLGKFARVHGFVLARR